MSRPWKFGGLKYLNSRPLIYDLPGELELATPAELTARFQNGELDAAILSVVDAFEVADVEIVPDAAIGCFGPVYSVVLAYQGELAEVRQIALDPSSRTSSGLLQILLREHFRLSPEYSAEPESENGARLIIGDPAIAFRQSAGPAWNFLDLGEAWRDFTGLPFVFAVWGVRRSHPDCSAIAQAIQESLRRGLASFEKIVAAESSPDFARSYLTRHIRYEFGDEQRRAVARFQEWLPAGR